MLPGASKIVRRGEPESVALTSLLKGAVAHCIRGWLYEKPQCLNQGLAGKVQAVLERCIGIDDGLWRENRFKTSLHFQIKIEAAVGGRMV